MLPLLHIDGLTVDFTAGAAISRAVDGLTLELEPGQTLGLVGESGSGKSVTALSLMRLLDERSVRYGGSIRFDTGGQEGALDLLALPPHRMRALRGSSIAMIFQEPMSSLNPVMRCGCQVTEAIRLHRRATEKEAQQEVLALFERVRLPDPQRIFSAFPHQLSGGQKQRVMIAMALSCRPRLLLADEPTTALDVTVQKTILDLLAEIRQQDGLSMLFISHDLGVVSQVADRVAVLHRGRLVEEGPVQQVLYAPQHPYTRGLLACRPSLYKRFERLPTVPELLKQPGKQARVVSETETQNRREKLLAQAPLLEVRDLSVRFPLKRSWTGRPTQWLTAVDGVSFDVHPGESFGLAGESGSGKSTLGRTLARLQPADSGQVVFEGTSLLDLSLRAFLPFRKRIQVVFQDPYGSLNPRMRLLETLTEPMKVHGLGGNAAGRRDRAVELLETVGLEADHLMRYPHQFSGGQRQRLCIARALALEPRLLICDEIVSALDVSVQATVLNLLMELQERLGLSYLFISHDLSVIRQVCDRLMVMRQGRVEALGFPEEVYAQQENPYVKTLVDSVMEL